MSIVDPPGEGSADPGQLVTVPIHVRDRSNTALDDDAGTDRTIRHLAVTVRYSPAAAAESVDFVKRAAELGGRGSSGGFRPRLY